MKYMVHPLETVAMTYVSMLDDLDSAKDQAWKLAQEHGVDVMVLQVIGTQRNIVKWTPEKWEPEDEITNVSRSPFASSIAAQIEAGGSQRTD